MKTPILRPALALALLAAAIASSAQNLVQDPGFESAVGSAGGLAFYDQGATIDGGAWSTAASPSGGYDALFVDRSPSRVISGAADVALRGASVRQTLATAPGLAYAISFDAYGYGASAPFSVAFGGESANLVAPVGGPATATHFSLLGVAASSATLLSLGNASGVDLVLDNVSVTPVQATPEPSALAAVGLGAMALVKRRRKD